MRHLAACKQVPHKNNKNSSAVEQFSCIGELLWKVDYGLFEYHMKIVRGNYTVHLFFKWN